MVENLIIPVICEGGIFYPEMACQPINFGAYAVVVGTESRGLII
ncbi:hypothetical protein ACE1AT_02565 [Pelatocladus sp. BLCC-F211]